MIFVFKSEGCPACIQLSAEFKKGIFNSWAGHVKFVDVKFSEEHQCLKGYIDGEVTEGTAPVEAVPAIYDTEIEKLIYGYDNIKAYLLHEHE